MLSDQCFSVSGIELPPEAVKTKLDPKELIQKKLLELKEKARKEAEKNAQERKKCLEIQIQTKITDETK